MKFEEYPRPPKKAKVSAADRAEQALQQVADGAASGLFGAELALHVATRHYRRLTAVVRALLLVTGVVAVVGGAVHNVYAIIIAGASLTLLWLTLLLTVKATDSNGYRGYACPRCRREMLPEREQR